MPCFVVDQSLGVYVHVLRPASGSTPRREFSPYSPICIGQLYSAIKFVCMASRSSVLLY